MEGICPYCAEKEARLKALEAERAEQSKVMAEMKSELEALKRQVFGRKSEKIPHIDSELRRVGRIKSDPAKAADSIPLYRMEKQFARLGIPIARATMVGLFHKSAELLKPVSDRIISLIRESQIVLADETPMKMQVKNETGESGKGYLWVFISENLIAYRFSPSRSGETPKQVLGGANGTLVVDAYTCYNKVIGPESRERAGCMAHVRRKFFDALSTTPEAKTALDFILELYKVEHEAKERDVVRKPEHLALRQKQSKPVMDRFHAWMMEQRSVHLPQGPMGRAITYALNNWNELSRFLKSEQLPIDNNAS